MAPFSTRTDLMPHQMPAVAKLLPPRVGALFMDMGTGKSRTLIELARLRQAKWDRLFWFTPCALRDNIVGQLLEHTDLRRDEITVWNDAALSAGIPLSSRVHVVGIETMSSSDRAVLAYNDRVTPESFVAVDESTFIKGNLSKRSQRITNMSARCRYRAILTGTPFTQGAVDLYGQMSFLSPKILGYRSFWTFARNHLEYEERRGPGGVKRRTGRIIRSHNVGYLAAKIAPYTYQVSKDECLSLPDKLFETVYIEMTGKQRALYEEAKKEILSLDYDDWSPIRIFHLFTSLQTIVCGFWKRPNGDVVTVDHDRVHTMMEVARAIPDPERVVVWAKYRAALDEIVERLRSEYGSDHVCPYHGGLNDEERRAQLSRWRGGARFLVATQSVGGYGLTLTEASHAIFYADGFKYSERLQAEDRLHRIGQSRRPTYVTLQCWKSVDDNIARAISRKGCALEDFQRQVNMCRRDRMRDKAIELVRSL